MPDLCKCCKMPPVEGCDGWGCIPIPDEKNSRARECPNMRIVRIRKALRPDIARAKHIKDSPLVGRHTENLFIHAGTWGNILPHLKSALGFVLLRRLFLHAVITDERIKGVFVGNERYLSRSRDERDDLEFNNGLADLMRPPELVIIRLGFLGHKNVAASGALKEALMIRQAEEKPTWIVESEQPFERGFCYSPELALYIEDRFEDITLDGAGQPNEDPGMELEEEASDETPPDKPPESEPPPPDEPDVDVDALEASIGGGNKKKSFKKSWGGRRYK